MSLSEIKDKLYKREEEKDLAKYDQISFDVRKSSVNPQEAGFKKTGDVWGETKDELKEDRNNAVKIGGIIFAVVLVVSALALGVYYIKQSSFNVDRVSIEINGDKEAASGKKLEYEIILNNNNRAVLENVILKVSYPESFSPEGNSNFNQEGALGGTFTLGDIQGHEQKKIIFKGKVYSPKGTIVYLKANMLFSPGGYSNQFSTDNQFGLSVTSSPITLNLMAPQNMSNGDSLDYLITYKNESLEAYENVKIKMEYPAGFTFSKSEPNVSEGDNIWYVGHLSAGQEGKIIVSGKMEGGKNEIKLAKVYVGEMSEGQFIAQNEERIETRIEESPIVISQTVNGLKNLSVNAGENLRFKIYYKNEGTIGLRDVIVTEKIDSVILDYGKMKFPDGGAVDMKNKVITWKASDIPGLKLLNPGDSGIIEFSVDVKDIIPVSGVQDKNFVISSIAKIDSPDIQTPVQGNKIIAGNKMDIKLNSKLFLGVKGLYYDAFMENSGPIPPKVGQETTYIIKWTVMNVSNNVSGVKVESTLPTGVGFTGKVYPEGANLTFNERTNSMVWDIGNLEAGTGILTASKEVSFQIKITPAPNQKDSYADLINEARITGKDLFTNSDLSIIAEKKTTYLTEDKKIGESGYKVKD